MKLCFSVHDLEIIWSVLIWAYNAPFSKTTKSEYVKEPVVGWILDDIASLCMLKRCSHGKMLPEKTLQKKMVEVEYNDIHYFDRIRACFDETFYEIGHSQTEVEIVIGNYDDFLRLREYFTGLELPD